MSRTSKIARKIPHLILSALEAAANGYLWLDECYRHPSKVFYGPDYDFPKSTVRSAVSRLARRGLVEKSIDQGKLILRLTNAGRDWVLKNEVEDGEGDWDGIWRLVIFDIPESHRKVRAVLRNKLKTWGFKFWQKSVWASKKNLTGELRKLIRELGVERWVLVVESNNTGRV